VSPFDTVALAGARWVLHAAAVLVLGHVGAYLVLRRSGFDAPARVERSLTRWSAVLLASTIGMLAAQAYSWFGLDAFASVTWLPEMVGQTAWGHAWRITALAATAVTGIAIVARLTTPGRPVLLLLAAAIVSGTVPLVGHGGSGGAFTRIMHGAHLAAAGFWIGTLVVLTLAAWPDVTHRAAGRDAIGSLLAAFSPLALISVGALFATGAVLSVQNVGSLAALTGTAYGRVLLAKAAGALVVSGLGFVNWRTHARRMDLSSIRRRAIVEWSVAIVVVLALTAWLGGLDQPRSLHR
jgi:putative copper export protein